MVLLVIIDQVYIYGLVIDETEYDSPVAGNAHAPLASTAPFQRMQPLTGTIHIVRRPSMLQIGQHSADAFDMGSIQPP